MSITNLDQVIAGAQPNVHWYKSSGGAAGNFTAGIPVSFWTYGGAPGAGTVNTVLAGGTYSSSSSLPVGALPHTDPGSGNSYLNRLSGFAQATGTGNPGTFWLCDRLWDNGGITITSTASQTVNSVAWPSRDQNGGTAGVGVILAVEVSAETGAGAPGITVTYTNSAGTASRTGNFIYGTGATRAQGNFYPIGLQSGDLGVQSVQSLQLTVSWTSGTINLVAFRILATLDVRITAGSRAIDCITGGFPRLYNGVTPFLVFTAGQAALFGATNVFAGQYVESQG